MMMHLMSLRGVLTLVSVCIATGPMFAQISPVSVGESQQEILDQLSGESGGIPYELYASTSESLKAGYSNEIGYEVAVTCDFENGRCTKTFVEWKASDLDTRVILRKWFEEVVSMNKESVAYARDPLMEKQLLGSYENGRSRVAVFVSEDVSERIILVFHAEDRYSYLSQMHQVYFWAEE